MLKNSHEGTGSNFGGNPDCRRVDNKPRRVPLPSPLLPLPLLLLAPKPLAISSLTRSRELEALLPRYCQQFMAISNFKTQ